MILLATLKLEECITSLAVIIDMGHVFSFYLWPWFLQVFFYISARAHFLMAYNEPFCVCDCACASVCLILRVLMNMPEF